MKPSTRRITAILFLLLVKLLLDVGPAAAQELTNFKYEQFVNSSDLVLPTAAQLPLLDIEAAATARVAAAQLQGDPRYDRWQGKLLRGLTAGNLFLQLLDIVSTLYLLGAMDKCPAGKFSEGNGVALRILNMGPEATTAFKGGWAIGGNWLILDTGRKRNTNAALVASGIQAGFMTWVDTHNLRLYHALCG